MRTKKTKTPRSEPRNFYPRSDESRHFDIQVYKWISAYAKRNAGNTPSLAAVAEGMEVPKYKIRGHFDYLRRAGILKLSVDGEWVLVGSIWIEPNASASLKLVASIATDELHRQSVDLEVSEF